MKTAIILHGMPRKEDYLNPNVDSESNSNWIPWLQQQLNVRGILTQTPEMPEPYNPNYEKYVEVFKQFKLNEDTMLIGHSCGAGFILKYLSENNIKVGKVVLVAPWINAGREADITMFDSLRLDENLVLKTKGVAIFESSDDEQDVMDSVEVIKNSVKNIKVTTFENYGHFCFGDMKTRAFPELLDEVLK